MGFISNFCRRFEKWQNSFDVETQLGDGWNDDLLKANFYFDYTSKVFELPEKVLDFPLIFKKFRKRNLKLKNILIYMVVFDLKLLHEAEKIWVRVSVLKRLLKVD